MKFCLSNNSHGDVFPIEAPGRAPFGVHVITSVLFHYLGLSLANRYVIYIVINISIHLIYCCFTTRLYICAFEQKRGWYTSVSQQFVNILLVFIFYRLMQYP